MGHKENERLRNFKESGSFWVLKGENDTRKGFHFFFFSQFYSCFFSCLCFFCSAAGGEIFDQCVADNDEAFTEKDVIRLAKQILNGVAFLHRNNVVHLDLKVRTPSLCDNGGQFIPSRLRLSETLLLLCNRSPFSVSRLFP